MMVLVDHAVVRQAAQRRARLTRGLVAVLVAAGVLAVARCAFAATPLLLAQVCFLESGWSEPDCAAIAGVVRRRASVAGVDFDAMLIQYSAIDSGTPRAVFCSQLPDADAPTWGPRTNARWERLRQFARRVLDGRAKDPCRGRATHWGARNLPREVRRAVSAIEAGRWRVVDCGPTLNAFYAEVRR